MHISPGAYYRGFFIARHLTVSLTVNPTYIISLIETAWPQVVLYNQKIICYSFFALFFIGFIYSCLNVLKIQ